MPVVRHLQLAVCHAHRYVLSDAFVPPPFVKSLVHDSMTFCTHMDLIIWVCLASRNCLCSLGRLPTKYGMYLAVQYYGANND